MFFTLMTLCIQQSYQYNGTVLSSVYSAKDNITKILFYHLSLQKNMINNIVTFC